MGGKEVSGPKMSLMKILDNLNSTRRSPYLTTVFRILLGVLFIYASIPKISSPAYFAIAVQNYQILPDLFINSAAIILPWIELICGLLLLAGYWHRATAVIISGLNVVFILAITSALIRGLDIECGCYGTEASANWTRIVEDLFLLAFSLHIVIYPESKFSLE